MPFRASVLKLGRKEKKFVAVSHTRSEVSPGTPRPLLDCLGESAVRWAVAGSDDLAARYLGRVWKQVFELLILNPGADDSRRLLALLSSVEQAERTKNAVAAFDEVVAGEPRKLAQLRDKRFVDLPLEFGSTTFVNALVTADGRIHLVLL